MQKGNPPTGVGTSLALETIIQNCPVDFKHNRLVSLNSNIYIFFGFVIFTFHKLWHLGYCLFNFILVPMRVVRAYMCTNNRSRLSCWWLHTDALDSLNCFRNEASINILVCSRGGGGLLVERMELVAELWLENFKVDISKQF